MKGILKIIDIINDRIGKIVSYITLIYTFLVIFEVIMRYIFNSPTIWSAELTYYLFGIQWLIAGAYDVLYDKHIKVDIIAEKFSKRTKAIADLFGALFFFLFIGTMFYHSLILGWEDMLIGKRSFSIWGPPIWPVELCIALGAFLLLLQGFAKVIRDISIVREGGEYK
ncbi:MAG: TRAP transporter small permease subunit [Clostridia bacterium]|jgi:TRAP-type mannitol/chloroaromatic compound transport system permease small subunit|nr:TRAP transporter small permease subunit [Clostridia bacterium]